MTDCIFCKIVKGEIPSHTVYEDENYLAFLDIEPYVPGHTLVIPKEHMRWATDHPHFGDYMETAKKVGLLLKEKLDQDFIQIFTYGLDVPHAHIHVMPRKEEGDRSTMLPEQQKMSHEELAEIASKVRKN